MANGSFDLGSNHKPFIKVAKGGSSCANCIFLTEDKKHCGNKLFVKWYGKSELPKDIQNWCSDWYEPNPDYLAKGGIVTARAPYYFRKEKKKQHSQQLARSLQALRSQVTKDLKSEDEKQRLTALVIAIIDKTAERVGNEGSEDVGHFGITGLRKKHVTIDGNKVILRYTGKSGVEHEKSFSDKLIAESLQRAIDNTPRRSIFVTSDGFRIKADRVNRYLSDYNVTAKDLRGHHANKYIIDKLKDGGIPENEKDRKSLFKKAVKYSALKVGHKPLTLQKHYLISEVETMYVVEGRIIDLTDFYNPDGNMENYNEGGITDSSIENSANKYGWIAKPVEGYGYELYNRKGNKVVKVKIEKNKYIFYDLADNVLIKGKGQIGASTEKLLTQYYYAQPTNNGKHGGILKGNTHEDGGIAAIVTDTNKPVELETNEAIINANSMQDENKYVVTGTPSEIASAINEVGGGVAFDKGAEAIPVDAKNPAWKSTFAEYVFTTNPERLKLARLAHSTQVKEAIAQHKYATAILNNEMTAHRAWLIIDSANIDIPSEIANLAAVENNERANDFEKQLADLNSETVIRAKEIKKVVTKQELIETIESLRILAESSTGKQKESIENTIDGLELLLESMPDQLEKGGYAIYKDGNVIDELYT